MIHNKKLVTTLMIALTGLSSVSVFGEERVSFQSVTVEANKSYTAREVVDAMDDMYTFPEDLVNDNSWVWILPNTRDFLTAETGTEFMNMLYPSGLRLPTMLIDANDAFYRDNDYNPVYYGNAARLLRILGEGRVNYTYSELNAAEKYFYLMQAKSIALGLPIFSFKEEFIPNYSDEVREEFIECVERFESVFGPIGFPNTASMDFDWCKLVQEDYDFDVTGLLLSGVNSFEYVMPTGSKTLELYSFFDNLDNSEMYSITETDREGYTEYFTSMNNYLEAFPKDSVVEAASYDLSKAYSVVCNYYSYILDNYDELYSNIHVGDADVMTLEEVLEKTSSFNENTETTENGEAYADDPYVKALREQSESPISAQTLQEAESEGQSVSSAFHMIRLLILAAVALMVAIIKLISYLMHR